MFELEERLKKTKLCNVQKQYLLDYLMTNQAINHILSTPFSLGNVNNDSLPVQLEPSGKAKPYYVSVELITRSHQVYTACLVTVL